MSSPKISTLARFAGPELADEVETWRRARPGRIPTMSAALRVLVAQGLDYEKNQQRPATERAA
jgi:hypothetical protein